jgi:hypothetical protein
MSTLFWDLDSLACCLWQAGSAPAIDDFARRVVAHHLDIDWLRDAYRRTRKDGATGIDGRSLLLTLYTADAHHPSGMFSYTLACKIPDKIAAIAPGNGYPLGGESGCTKTRPVPMFHMHGTADDFVKYSGIHAFLNTKIAEYGCPATPVLCRRRLREDHPSRHDAAGIHGQARGADSDNVRIIPLVRFVG